MRFGPRRGRQEKFPTSSNEVRRAHHFPSLPLSFVGKGIKIQRRGESSFTDEAPGVGEGEGGVQTSPRWKKLSNSRLRKSRIMTNLTSFFPAAEKSLLPSDVCYLPYLFGKKASGSPEFPFVRPTPLSLSLSLDTLLSARALLEISSAGGQS